MLVYMKFNLRQSRHFSQIAEKRDLNNSFFSIYLQHLTTSGGTITEPDIYNFLIFGALKQEFHIKRKCYNIAVYAIFAATKKKKSNSYLI